MKENIKSRVIELLELLSIEKGAQITIRGFCLENGINYKSLYNAFKADSMGIALIDKFKEAVPYLNMNWFLYGEETVFLTHKLPNEL